MQRAEALDASCDCLEAGRSELVARSKLANDAACNRLHTAALQRAADLVLRPA